MLAQRILLIGFVCLWEVSCSSSQEAAELRAPTNLDVIRTLAGKIAERIPLDVSAGDSVAIIVLPKETAWCLEGAIAERLSKRGMHMATNVDSARKLRFGIIDARVVYSNQRRSGILGAKLVDRDIRLKLEMKISNRFGDKEVPPSIAEESQRDTVRSSEAAGLENPFVAFTKGSMETEGFFSTLAEPLIMIGATAVAVFLLFAVRS
jgi:hypothetical protein